jgi:hypothetical protein
MPLQYSLDSVHASHRRDRENLRESREFELSEWGKDKGDDSSVESRIEHAEPPPWRPRAGLIAAFLLHTILHFPFVWHAAGQMDEQFFAVPGLTVLREGIPRIPFAPTREIQSFFMYADRCLFALPPALHYVQAPFFAVFTPSYTTARLPLFLGAYLCLWLTWRISLWLFQDGWIAGVAVCSLAVSRPMLFTSITARPDLLCTCCGLAAVWTAMNLSSARPLVSSLLTGAIVGLGALFHPVAIVFGFQMAAVAVYSGRGWFLKIRNGFVFSAAALMVLSLWLPLILAYPAEFEAQFLPNVFNRGGPGLLHRLIWPWRALQTHAFFQWEYNQAIQFVLLGMGLVGATVLWLFRRHERRIGWFLLLAWTAGYLTATCPGSHPTKGYWLYPIAMYYPLLVWLLFEVLRTVIGSDRLRRAWLQPVLAVVLMASLLPGAGIRFVTQYMRHWSDPRYQANRFIAKVLEEYPKDKIFLCDVSYVLDVYLSGRETIVCQAKQQFWGGELEYDYMILGSEGFDLEAPSLFDGESIAKHGAAQNAPECFAEVYRHVHPNQAKPSP